jgi:hypothetical protein
MKMPRDEWGGLLGFEEIGWHIQTALQFIRLNRELQEAEPC